jgi:hypothetical protein
MLMLGLLVVLMALLLSWLLPIVILYAGLGMQRGHEKLPGVLKLCTARDSALPPALLEAQMDMQGLLGMGGLVKAKEQECCSPSLR